jgi:hypothetical protein
MKLVRPLGANPITGQAGVRRADFTDLRRLTAAALQQLESQTGVTSYSPPVTRVRLSQLDIKTVLQSLAQYAASRRRGANEPNEAQKQLVEYFNQHDSSFTPAEQFTLYRQLTLYVQSSAPEIQTLLTNGPVILALLNTIYLLEAATPGDPSWKPLLKQFNQAAERELIWMDLAIKKAQRRSPDQAKEFAALLTVAMLGGASPLKEPVVLRLLDAVGSDLHLSSDGRLSETVEKIYEYWVVRGTTRSVPVGIATLVAAMLAHFADMGPQVTDPLVEAYDTAFDISWIGALIMLAHRFNLVHLAARSADTATQFSLKTLGVRATHVLNQTPAIQQCREFMAQDKAAQ